MSARELTVAHQKPGECEYCDRRHAEIVTAVAHELAEKIRAAGCQEVNWCGCPIAADLIDPEVGGD